jgi:hypothetical protein
VTLLAVRPSQISELQDKVASFEMGVLQIEADAESRCQQIVAEAMQAVKLANEEKEKIATELVASKAELSLSTQYKSQVHHHSIDIASHG